MIERASRQAINTVRNAGKFIAEHAGKVKPRNIELKSMNSLVSYVDKEAEKILVEGLSEIIPESVFITEEDTIDNEDGEWQWIVDPLDGTTNFLHNIPIYSVSVALRHNQKTVCGIVYNVAADEMFYAIKDLGAFLNDNPIVVSTKDTEDSLLATGFPYSDFSKLDEYMDALESLMQQTRGLRRLGSAALDLAFVAAGRFDVFFEYGLNPWDVAAGAFLVKEASGVVTNFNNGEDYLFTRQIVAGNPTVHKDVMRNIKMHLGTDIQYI